MNYQPNFSDRRVLARTRRALGFVQACLHETRPRAWSTRYLDRVFGRTNDQLGAWLRQRLLQVVNEHYNHATGQCKQYCLNTQGYQQVQQLISSGSISAQAVAQQVREWTESEFHSELSTRQFTYRDLSNRLWHPLQNLRREAKQQTLRAAGFCYQYDIQCCAPRLLWQHSYLHQALPWTEIPEYIDAYIRDRNGIRQAIAQQAELDPSAIKVLINALFSGARLGCNPQFVLYRMLNQDRARMTYLQQNRFIQGLQQDIRVMWQYIAPSMTRRTIQDRNSRTRLVPLNSRDKWTRYFELERQVLNSAMDYMNANEIEFFAEHDGWTTTSELDQNSLRNHVRTATGFDIKLDLEVLD